MVVKLLTKMLVAFRLTYSGMRLIKIVPSASAGKISRVAWIPGSTIFLLLVSLIVLSEMDLVTLSGHQFSFRQISIYEKMLHIIEVCFGVLSALMGGYLSARHMLARGFYHRTITRR